MDRITSAKLLLMLALFLIPISGFPLHTKLHADIWWINYIVLFDAVIITGMFYFKKTRFWGFWLNSVVGVTGILMHFGVGIMGTLTELALSVGDLAIGFALVYMLRSGREAGKQNE